MEWVPQMADALSRATKEIDAAQGLPDTLEAIVRAARDSLPGIQHVGVSVGHRDGRIQTIAATDDLVLQLDTIQHDLREGPCVYAMKADTITRVEHARHEQRWPNYIPRAVQLGLRSQMGVRLHLDDAELAVMNLYSTENETLDNDLEDYAELFASYASLALGRARREDQLNTALVTRRVIGQAIGIVMGRYNVDEERAFRYLTRISNDSNIKLREVAQRIVDEANEKGAQAKNGG